MDQKWLVRVIGTKIGEGELNHESEMRQSGIKGSKSVKGGRGWITKRAIVWHEAPELVRVPVDLNHGGTEHRM